MKLNELLLFITVVIPFAIVLVLGMWGLVEPFVTPKKTKTT